MTFFLLIQQFAFAQLLYKSLGIFQGIFRPETCLLKEMAYIGSIKIPACQFVPQEYAGIIHPQHIREVAAEPSLPYYYEVASKLAIRDFGPFFLDSHT